MAKIELINKLNKFPNTSINHGQVTAIKKGTMDSFEDTTLKIGKDDGHEYNFTGLKAHYAVTHPYHPMAKYQEVSFLTDDKTHQFVAIIMKTFDGHALLRLDEDLYKECQTWESGYNGCFGRSSYPALAGANPQARTIVERALLFSGVMGTVLGPAQAVMLDTLGAKDALSICM